MGAVVSFTVSGVGCLESDVWVGGALGDNVVLGGW